jgi:hypothetical protein
MSNMKLQSRISMTTSFTRVRTRYAKDYLCLLVNHSTRSVSSESDGVQHAIIELQRGICKMTAGDRCLDISITADSISDAVMLEDVISECLDDVARGEELQYQWTLTPSRNAQSRNQRRPHGAPEDTVEPID